MSKRNDWTPRRKVISRRTVPRPVTYRVILKLECGHEHIISAGPNPTKYGYQRTVRCLDCYFAKQAREFKEQQAAKAKDEGDAGEIDVPVIPKP